MKTFLFLLLLNVLSFSSEACCGERIQRFIPIGEAEGKIWFAEIVLSRRCGELNASRDMPYILRTQISVYSFTDSMRLEYEVAAFEMRDTVNTVNAIVRCQPEVIIQPYLDQIFAEFKAKNGVLMAIPEEIIFNDTAHFEIISTEDKELIQYKDWLELDITYDAYYSTIKETRTYSTKNHTIQMVRLTTGSEVPDKREVYISERFKTLQTNFWEEEVVWHGNTRDEFRIDRKGDGERE